MLHTPHKNFFIASLLLIAGISANITLAHDTHAVTSAEATGSATVTLHVLEADTATTIPDNPSTTDNDDYTEYTEPSDDDPEDPDVDLGGEDAETDDELSETDEDATDEDDVDPEEAEEDAMLATADGDDSTNSANPGTPDTGALTGSTDTDSSFNPLPLILAVVAVAFIALIIKAIKDERSSQIRRQLHRRAHLLSNSRFGLNFKHEGFRKYPVGKIIRYSTASIMAVFVGICLFNNNSAEETDAASAAYPYTISLENGGNYDIYVKQGDFARASFAIKTTTNNPTGYTLAMAASNQSLTSGDNSIATTTTNATADSLADNTWGFSTNGTTYSQVLNMRSAGTTLRKTGSASASGNFTPVYFGFKVASDLPAGDYTTTIQFAAQTNQVVKKLKIANANVATVTRVSDGTTLTNGKNIILGEELKITNSADVAGITQTATVDSTTFSGSKTITVSDDVTVSTTDDSMHFIKNTYKTGTKSAIGDAILVKSQGKAWMVDTGRHNTVEGALNGKAVASYLKSLGVESLDYLLLTHMHADHYGGVNYLVTKKYINNNTTVYLRGCSAVRNLDKYTGTKADTSTVNHCQTVLKYLTQANANIINLDNHESVRASLYSNGLDFGNYHIDFFNIDKDSSTGKISYNPYRENLNSIGTKWTHKPSGKTAFLAGDFEWGNEATYGPKIGKVDILKAGHHGIKTSSSYEFYKTLNPSTVIVTSQDMATKNGNPQRQQAAWAYVQQRGGSVYFTGSSTGGAVALSFTNSGYSVKKGKKKNVIADANTAGSNASYDGNVSSYAWSGGLTAWSRPYNKTGKGGSSVYAAKTSADDSSHFFAANYVWVYQSPSSSGNLISKVDRYKSGKDTNGNTQCYKYGFKSDNGDGVSNQRTKVAKSNC